MKKVYVPVVVGLSQRVGSVTDASLMILYISSETWAVPAVSMNMVKVFAGQSVSVVVKKVLMVFY